jgi:hypothetical protein
MDSATVGAIVLVLVLFALYWFPTFIAIKARKPNVGAIAVLNLFLGWTFIGWVIALVWAFKVDAADVYRMERTAAQPTSPETPTETEYDMVGRRIR